MATNHYQRLGVNADATTDEIRRAYRARAKAAHPDAGGDPAEFRLLLTAYETLVREDRRRDYDDALGIRAPAPPPPEGGRRDAGWEGRHGDFSGDVSFPAWMRGITDEQWIPPPPDDRALDDPERVAAEAAAARDRPPTQRRADVAWWWPDLLVGAPAQVGDHLLVAGARALARLDGATGLEVDRLALADRLRTAPVVTGDDLAVAFTEDGTLHAVGLAPLAPRWQLAFGPPAAGGAVGADAGRRGPVVLAARADARLAALRADTGEVHWSTKLAAPAAHRPAVGDGVAVVVAGDRTVEAVDVASGRHRWRVHLRTPIPLPPVVLGYSVWLAGGGPAGALVQLDVATGAVQGTYGAGDAIGGLTTDGTSLFVTASGPARLLALDERGRVELAVATERVCAEPATTRSYAYLADPAGRVLAVDRSRQRLAAVSGVLFEPVGAPYILPRSLALVARDGHVWAVVRPEEQAAVADA